MCVYVCVLNTKPNILHSYIPPKERKYSALLKEIMKNTKLRRNLNCYFRKDQLFQVGSYFYNGKGERF